MLALYLRHIGRLAYLLSLPGRPGTTPDISGSTQPTCTGSNCIHTCPLIRTFFSTDLQTRLKQDRTKRNPHSESANSQHTGQNNESGIFPHMRSSFQLPFFVLYAPHRQSHPHDVLSPVLPGYPRCPVVSARLAWTPTSRRGNFGETGTVFSFASFACMFLTFQSFSMLITTKVPRRSK